MSETDLSWMEKTHVWIALLFAAGSLFLKPAGFSASILFGFFIGFGNYWLLKKLVVKLIKKQAGRIRLLLLFGLKYLILTAFLGVWIIYFDLHVMGLLIGLSTLVMAILALAIKTSMHTS